MHHNFLQNTSDLLFLSSRRYPTQIKTQENAIHPRISTGIFVCIPPLKKTLTLKRGPALEGRRERGGVISWELFTLSQMIFLEGGEGEDCNIESVTGRLAGAQLWGRSRIRTEACTYALTAQDLRIIAPEKDPYCALWSGQFTVDILTRKEYKERDIKR